MLTEQQIEMRKTGIGGSEVAAILGICPYSQPYNVYVDKLGLAAPKDFSDNEGVYWGNALEEAVAKRYEDINSVKLRKKNQSVRHKKHDWLVASIDRDIVGVRKGLEIKNVGYRMAHYWGPDGSDEAAEYYVPQPHHYMLVLDYEAWDLSAVIGGQELRTYHFERDREMDELIIEATHDFWHNHVLKEIPPDIDFTHKYIGDVIKRVYKNVEGESILLDDKALHWTKVMQEAAEQEKMYKKAKESAKFHLMSLVGENSVGILPDGTGFKRKIVKRKAYDVDATEYVDFRFTKNPPIEGNIL